MPVFFFTEVSMKTRQKIWTLCKSLITSFRENQDERSTLVNLCKIQIEYCVYRSLIVLVKCNVNTWVRTIYFSHISLQFIVTSIF